MFVKEQNQNKILINCTTPIHFVSLQMSLKICLNTQKVLISCVPVINSPSKILLSHQAMFLHVKTQTKQMPADFIYFFPKICNYFSLLKYDQAMLRKQQQSKELTWLSFKCFCFLDVYRLINLYYVWKIALLFSMLVLLSYPSSIFQSLNAN